MIEFVNVTKQFSPSSVAVDDVSFTVVAGEFLTLLGPSGCGKTTILRMISGFELPTSGSIFLNGQEVFDAPPYKRDVNQVFQSYALFPHLNVARNIEFGLKMKRLPRAQRTERIEQAIAMLNLSGLESRKPSQLSGGQRQRVALARALVNRPKVLLLDEPLAALDAKLRKSVQIELKQLQRRLGITFVFVTHDQEEALTMSDRIAVMNGGKIEQLAAAQEIYHRPATAFVADFIGQTNLLRPREVRWDGGSLRVRIDDTIQLAVACDESPPDLSRVSLSIRPEKLRIDCDANTLNSFSARVTDRIFRGEVTQLILQCASGLELSAIVTERVDRPIEVGADLRCAIDPRDVVVLN